MQLRSIQGGPFSRPVRTIISFLIAVFSGVSSEARRYSGDYIHATPNADRRAALVVVAPEDARPSQGR